MKHEHSPWLKHSPRPEQEYIDRQLPFDDADDDMTSVVADAEDEVSICFEEVRKSDLYVVNVAVSVSIFVSGSVARAQVGVCSDEVCDDVPNADPCHESVTEPSVADDEDK